MLNNQILDELNQILIDYFKRHDLVVSRNLLTHTHRPWVDIFLGKAKEEFFSPCCTKVIKRALFNTSEEYISWVSENGTIGCKFAYLENIKESKDTFKEITYIEKFKIFDYILNKLTFGNTVIFSIPHKVSRLTWFLFITRRASSLKWFFYRKKFKVKTCRGELAALHVNHDNSLNDFIRYAFIQCIPVDLLEAFPGIYKDINLKFKTHTRCISAHAIQLNTAFKVLVSMISGIKGEIISLQHGGGYGLDLNHFSEAYEKKVSSKFYYWGEGIKQDLPFMPLPVSSFKQKSPRYFLLVCMPDLYSEEIMGNKEDVLGNLKYDAEYKSDIYNFLSWLIKAGVDFRIRIPPSVKKGSNYYCELMGKFKDIKFDQNKNVIDSYRNHQLIVHTYMGTGWIESLMMGVNTLVYEKHNKIKPEYIDAFSKLRANQVLFSNIRVLFNRVISDNQSPQEGVDRLIEPLYKRDEDWDKTWDKAFSLKKVI